MLINQLVLRFINENKQSIAFFKNGFDTSVSSLIYSEFLYNIKQLEPRKMIIPKIDNIRSLFIEDSILINYLINKLPEDILNDKIYDKYKDRKEFKIFEDKEMIKYIIDIYLVESLRDKIIFDIKDRFDTESEKITIIESESKKLFENGIQEYHLKYICHQILLDFIYFVSINKCINLIIDNNEFNVNKNQILSINNEAALAPIYLDENILNNDFYKVLGFVTSTEILDVFNNIYKVRSGKNNKIFIIDLEE